MPLEGAPSVTCSLRRKGRDCSRPATSHSGGTHGTVTTATEGPAVGAGRAVPQPCTQAARCSEEHPKATSHHSSIVAHTVELSNIVRTLELQRSMCMAQRKLHQPEPQAQVHLHLPRPCLVVPTPLGRRGSLWH